MVVTFFNDFVKKGENINNKNKKNWWNRNWKWFVPVGCLGSLAVFLGFIALIICLVFGAMKSSDVYKEAVLKAKSDQSIQKIIGVPIEERFLVTGNINIKNSSGRANLSIPIVGPEGKATIYVVAAKTAGKWTFSTLVVEIKKNKQRINLLE